MVENFKERSIQFREAVCRLTGYRFDPKSNTTYRLSSMFADSPEETLLFEVNKIFYILCFYLQNIFFFFFVL